MKKLSLICMTLLAISFMASCRGPQGPAGHDGNANVASATVTIDSMDWRWSRFFIDNNGYDRGQYYVTIDHSAVNDNVYNYGAVLAYMYVDGAWSQVPLTYYYSPDDDEFGNPNLYAASIEVATLNDGGVNLFWTQNDLWKVRPATHEFKIVAIEASAFEARRDVDYSNYEAVKTAYQLAED